MTFTQSAKGPGPDADFFIVLFALSSFKLRSLSFGLSGGKTMKYQAVFERYEIKYLITEEKKSRILKAMAPYMSMDEYGRTTIRNIYYDTFSPVARFYNRRRGRVA